MKTSTFCQGCGILTAPKNALILEEGSNPGDVFKIRCKDGYEMSRGTEERTCLIHGAWSGKGAKCGRKLLR